MMDRVFSHDAGSAFLDYCEVGETSAERGLVDDQATQRTSLMTKASSRPLRQTVASSRTISGYAGAHAEPRWLTTMYRA